MRAAHHGFLFLCLLLCPALGIGAGLSFTGSLERVGEQSISVKLAGRTVIDAMARNAPELANQYRFGDEVSIDYQIDPAHLGCGRVAVSISRNHGDASRPAARAIGIAGVA